MHKVLSAQNMYYKVRSYVGQRPPDGQEMSWALKSKTPDSLCARKRMEETSLMTKSPINTWEKNSIADLQYCTLLDVAKSEAPVNCNEIFSKASGAFH